MREISSGMGLRSRGNIPCIAAEEEPFRCSVRAIINNGIS